MNKYEILFIVDGSLSDEDKEKTVSAVKTLIENAGGTAAEPDKWGMRKFAYPIAYKQEGYYALINFEADDSKIKSLTEKLNINKNVVRHMIVAK